MLATPPLVQFPTPTHPVPPPHQVLQLQPRWAHPNVQQTGFRGQSSVQRGYKGKREGRAYDEMNTVRNTDNMDKTEFQVDMEHSDTHRQESNPPLELVTKADFTSK